MYFEGVFLTLICIGAFIGNLSIWIIICKSKDLRTVTNAFILSLTTADLLVAFINMPVTILTIFFGDWIMEDKECIIFGFINMFTLVLSVMSLCNISINRYIMVCKPIHFKTIYTKRNACIMICSCVTVSLLLSSPPLFGWAKYAYIVEQSFCFCLWTEAPSYAFFMIGCCFGIPFGVMTVCNILIFKTVRASRKRVAGTTNTINVKSPDSNINADQPTLSSSQNDQTAILYSKRISGQRLMVHKISTIDDVQLEVSTTNSTHLSVKKKQSVKRLSRLSKEKDKARSDEIRLALALAIVVIMFVICWLPFCISMLIGIFNASAAPDAFHMWTLLIGYSNSSMNPVIYGALNKKFGQGFKDIFCRMCNRNL